MAYTAQRRPKSTTEPGELRAYPWRFILGQPAYVLGRPQDLPIEVVGGELWMGCPHLRLLDRDGDVWRVAQLHCSSKPITFARDR